MKIFEEVKIVPLRSPNLVSKHNCFFIARDSLYQNQLKTLRNKGRKQLTLNTLSNLVNVASFTKLLKVFKVSCFLPLFLRVFN